MLDVRRIDTWVAPVADQVGSLRQVLEDLSRSGADLEIVICHRSHGDHRGAVFVAPITGLAQEAAAEKAGFRRSNSLHSLRISGHNEPGTAYLITRALAEQEISIRGMSAATIDARFVMYLAFDSEGLAARAAERLRRAL